MQYDVWVDLAPINSQAAESLGYPTQPILRALAGDSTITNFFKPPVTFLEADLVNLLTGGKSFRY